MTYDTDPYMILGVPQTASPDDIHRAYQSLSRRLNPDINPYREAASDQFIAVADAYNLLINSVERRKYDEYASQQKQRRDESGAYYSMRVTPSKRTIVPMPETQVIYLLAEIAASPQAAQAANQRESHVNLTLVLDHSKSMEDEKRMDKVKAAAQAIITELSNQDVISIVAFNDRASIVIPATPVQDKMALRARVSMIQPKGGTEIYRGLEEGVRQVRKHLNPMMVNHILLLTDGQTYGDEDKCLQLARAVTRDGISISAMGLGAEWNDQFLDQLVSLTGGTSTYIKSVNMVQDFMDAQVRNLSNAFAERMQLSVVPDPDIELEMAFKLSPTPQPLNHEDGLIHLASLHANRTIGVLLQLQLPAGMRDGYRSIARLAARGDLMQNQATTYRAISDVTLEVSSESAHTDGPPSAIVDALSKLTLYRMQQRAQEAMDRGDIEEATRQLQYLATRLIDMGEPEMGRQAMAEAQHVAQTRAFSNDASGKTIKYGTRALMAPGGMKEALTELLSED